MGREDLSEKPEFATNDSRVKNHQAVRAVVEEWMRARTVKEAAEVLLEHGVPVAPVLDVAQVVADPNFAVDREMVVEVEGPGGRTYRVIGCPIKMSLTPPRVRGRAPLLGEHTAEIVGTAGQR
ncbi:MAG: CoA transferase [Thermoleophilia bacterium]|nr:CoA transferase [Thermoleophilia bacterium]